MSRLADMIIHINVLLYNSLRPPTQLEEVHESDNDSLQAFIDYLSDIASLKVRLDNMGNLTTIPDW